jgi:ketosteroid isomerase-like protein
VSLVYVGGRKRGQKRMTEHTSIELVQQAYRSVGSGDLSKLLDALSSDVIWELPEMEHVPFSGTWHGREGVAEFFRRLVESQDVLEFEPEEFMASGEKVIVLGTFTMHVKATNRNSRSAWVHVWTIKDGKVSRMREYVDTLAVSRAHTP